jgi:hypothetical protein
MMARDRRYRPSRPAALKAWAALAAAALAGGAAITVAAVAASSHGARPAAQPAAYAVRSTSEGTMLGSAIRDWNSSRQGTYSQLAQLTGVRGYSQAADHGQTLDIQRGIVVLATSSFLILESANGSLHLWLLSAGTQVQDVSGSAAGTEAMTANASATQQALASGDLVPATTLLAGSPLTAAGLLTPTAIPQTVSVQVANTDLTVTVTVTRSTATVSVTATTPAGSTPAADPVTFTQSAFQATDLIARGDLAVAVGTRSHGTLHAQLILFTPLSTSDVGRLGSTIGAPTHW